MITRALAFASLPLAAASCAPADPAADAARAAAAIAAAPEATITGPGQNCIDTSQIRQAAVRSDRVIDFEMTAAKVYRSVLPAPCAGLGWDRAIAYETSFPQLCRQEIVYSLTTVGGVPQRGAACALGEFVPIAYVKD
ncbi:hypothetical protein [Erythrobacter sp. R86502]|uniref:hypothetical protein n=1 Tax=Erythrobacter sp. R86502 TaxID=3093846 RepID=UPI0036D282E5